MQNINQIKQSALTSFQEMGYPTTKQEDWRFTNLKKLKKTKFVHPSPLNETPLPEDKIQSYIFDDAHNLIFVNSNLQTDVNTIEFPDDVVIKNLSEILDNNSNEIASGFGKILEYSNHPFAAQNTSEMKNGFYIHIPNNIEIEKPMQVLWVITEDQPIQSFPRVFIHCGKSTRISVVEQFVTLSSVPAFTNAVTEIQMDTHAQVDYIRIQNEGESVFHISGLGVHQEANSRFTGNTITFGGNLTRNDVDIHLNGIHAECSLNGLYTMHTNEQVDNHTKIYHNAPHTSSRENYNGIATDHAQGVFDGKIIVKKEAVKTDSIQTNRNILLSDKAGVNSNPCLEIYTDDVKCKHGSTTGQLDEDAIFYLQTRGIDPMTAQSLLLTGFAGEILDEIKQETVKLYVNNLLTNWMNKHNSKN